MIVRSTHQEKWLERSFEIHTGHNTAGKVRIQNFNFWTCGENSEIKRQPIRNQRSGKEFLSNGKEMRAGVPVTV